MSNPAVTIELDKYRRDRSQRSWELPPWGHPISYGVYPLFISYDQQLFPLGTAFSIGNGITFIASAAHNIAEALRYERRLSHLQGQRELPKKLQLKDVGFYVLVQQFQSEPKQLKLLPLETVNGAPPSDVVFGFPRFEPGLLTAVQTLSFDLPSIGERVRSIGYCDFNPRVIPWQSVAEGTFDWAVNYSHRLVVVEGFVERIFTQRFASGFVEGACFSFDAEIMHGQSGGPVISDTGLVRGINSAGASSFFDRPASVASLLYPFLFLEMQFGVQLGPVRMNGSQPMISLIERGSIRTDGSEQRVGITFDETENKFVVNPVAPTKTASYVHDDFTGFKKDLKASKQTTPVYYLRQNADDQGSEH